MWGPKHADDQPSAATLQCCTMLHNAAQCTMHNAAQCTNAIAIQYSAHRWERSGAGGRSGEAEGRGEEGEQAGRRGGGEGRGEESRGEERRAA